MQREVMGLIVVTDKPGHPPPRRPDEARTKALVGPRSASSGQAEIYPVPGQVEPIGRFPGNGLKARHAHRHMNSPRAGL